MTADDEQPFSDIEATLKKAASALRGADVPFLLGGSLASWARGGPETRHDLDLMIKRADVDRGAGGARPRPACARRTRRRSGSSRRGTATCSSTSSSRPRACRSTTSVIARGEDMAVLSMQMRVMAIEDVLITKLMAIDEHHIRFEGLLPIARALREQIDWAHVRAATRASPFARAFFVLLEGLEIVPPDR